jgi:uncharacterized protein (DUF58 family)
VIRGRESAGPEPRSRAAELVRRVRRIEIGTRRAVKDTLSGQYHSVFKGRGMVFSEVRPYAPGDEVRTIDWNVAARTGQLHVKRFVEERELTVMLLCDLSPSADFGSRERTKAEVSAELAALLAMSAVANGDRVGLVLFTDRVERFVPPRKGRRHALRIVSEILQFRPEGRGTAIGAALELLRRALRRTVVAFVISDFLESPTSTATATPGREAVHPERSGAGGAAESKGPTSTATATAAHREEPFPFERALRIAARRHDVIPVRLADRLDAELPAAGIAWIEDPETGAVVRADLSDPGLRARFAAAARSDDERLARLFARLELDHVTVRADEADHVKPLLAFFRARVRRRGG